MICQRTMHFLVFYIKNDFNLSLLLYVSKISFSSSWLIDRNQHGKLDHTIQHTYLHNYSGVPSLGYNHYIMAYSLLCTDCSSFLDAFSVKNMKMLLRNAMYGWDDYNATTWYWFGLKINGCMGCIPFHVEEKTQIVRGERERERERRLLYHQYVLDGIFDTENRASYNINQSICFQPQMQITTIILNSLY